MYLIHNVQIHTRIPLRLCKYLNFSVFIPFNHVHQFRFSTKSQAIGISAMAIDDEMVQVYNKSWGY